MFAKLSGDPEEGRPMNPVTALGVGAIAVVSITSHEAAHGFMADRLGDPTARERGRLTLNPIPHIDLFFTILLPLFLILSGSGFIFGGAKPVPVDVARLRNPRRDWALVGAAGPGLNVLIAIGLTAILSVVTLMGVADRSSSLTEILAVGIFLNALLAVFNLIPIPPLDGSRVVQYFLSGEALTLYRRIEQFGLIIIVALVFLVPQLQVALSSAIFGLVELITIPFGVTADVEPLLRRLLFG
jgi:Zn-dependent protease